MMRYNCHQLRGPRGHTKPGKPRDPDFKLCSKTLPKKRCRVVHVYTSKKAHRNDLSRAIAWIACWRP
eukprot:symbB.v1.2.007501.t1/scaffold444.1/size204903/1